MAGREVIVVAVGRAHRYEAIRRTVTVQVAFRGNLDSGEEKDTPSRTGIGRRVRTGNVLVLVAEFGYTLDALGVAAPKGEEDESGSKKQIEDHVVDCHDPGSRSESRDEETRHNEGHRHRTRSDHSCSQ